MLWGAKQRGVSFDRLLTLGHQNLCLHKKEVNFLRREYRAAYRSHETPLDGYRWGQYADDFLREFLGASSITVIDASPYEGADMIHDMNTPVPEAWRGRYDAVIDGGSLEHIFNVPVALANLAKVLKVGGPIFITSPANNLMGHGFYQFSPELMFRVFSEANGFSLQRVLILEARYPSVELSKNHKVYEVIDPEEVCGRVGLVSKKPVMMMVEATKVHDAQMFASAPLQSDYVATWSSRPEQPTTSSSGKRIGSLMSPRSAASRLLHAMPLGLRAPLLGWREKRRFSLRNGRYYRRLRWQ